MLMPPEHQGVEHGRDSCDNCADDFDNVDEVEEVLAR